MNCPRDRDTCVLCRGNQAQCATVQEHIGRLVDTAPPLTPAQRDRLQVLLRPTR